VCPEFFVQFIVLVLYHEHKEYQWVSTKFRVFLVFFSYARNNQWIMPMKPTPTIPILTILKSL